MLVETRFLVPIREDLSIGNGDIHVYAKWEQLQKDLFTLFGGYTVSPGLYNGEYIDEDTGKPVADESRQYIIAIEGGRISELIDYLRTSVTVDFKQKCIYFSKGNEVEFIESAEIK